MRKDFRIENDLDSQGVAIEELMSCMPLSVKEDFEARCSLASRNSLFNRKGGSYKQMSLDRNTSILKHVEPDKFSESAFNNELLEQTNLDNSKLKTSSQRKRKNMKKGKHVTQITDNVTNGEQSSFGHFQQTGILKDIIKKHKINSIVRNFIKKIKRVSVLKEPVHYSFLEEYQKNVFKKSEGFELPQFTQNIISLVSILQILLFAFTLSISLVYPQVHEKSFTTYSEAVTLVVLTIEILVNLFSVKYHSGKKIQKLVEIWQFYWKGYLLIDLLMVFILICSLYSQSFEVNYFKIIILLKIPQCMDKIQRLQIYFIKNLYNQQYWSLIKILLFNFCFAHIISILLAGMANLSPGNNWMTRKNIEYAHWLEKYSWSYYWANTIMLTVGFGDLVAQNYKEAICLVFIETFSCMAFAYNINCIGTIIQQIRAKDAERSQKSKIFTKLNDKNKLSEQLSWKINNYIEETARLRKLFNYEEEREFISNLPLEMKKDYLKQSNKNLFQNIPFFKSFISKTLYNLAEKIEMKVSHPQEVIQHLYDDYNLMILKTGRLGFICKRPNFEMPQLVMDTKQITEKDKPYLVNMDFICRKRCFYQIKSIEYSIFYFLPYEKFIEVLRQTDMDFEYFCTLRDRMKCIPDEFQSFDCETCKGKHIKAQCPKLHYIPYIQSIIHRYLHDQKISYNKRESYQRIKNQRYQNAFYVYRKSIENVEKLGSLIQARRKNKFVSDNSSSVHEQSEGFIAMKSLKQETEAEKELKQLTEKYKTVTIETLREEIGHWRRNETLEDDIWMLKNDTLHNFNSYFPDHNPSTLIAQSMFVNERVLPDNIINTLTTNMLQHIKTKKTMLKSITKKTIKSRKD